MSKILIISNLSLCKGNFLLKTRRLFEAGIWGFMLREKELEPKRYEMLLKEIYKISLDFNVKIFAHKHTKIASNLGIKNIHLPLCDFDKNEISNFEIISSPVHNMNEVNQALNLGANFLVASHIFHTKCKPDKIPCGVEFIKDIKNKFNICVFGLGGINKSNFCEIYRVNGNGIAIMSEAMQCENEKEFVKNFLI